MIPAAPAAQKHNATPPARPAALWQQLWRQAERDPRRLLARLGLDEAAARLSDEAAAQFITRVPQGFINRLMARYARQGQVVARIKGGDAMLFGRGGEEVAYLQERGLSVEVVNGLTSGLVGATRAGIPLTHRDYTRGVTFVTAHAQDHSEPDWAALAATGTTLVIYMGMSRLSSIQAGLRAAGLPAEMPAAVIERAASPDERVLVTSLGLLAREAQLGGYASPAVIVVGEVVALATVREAELRRCWARCA